MTSSSTAPPSDELVVAAVLACSALVAMLVCRALDPDHEAERWYEETSPTLARVMQACFFVLGVALAFNGRYLAWQAASRVRAEWPRASKRWFAITRRQRARGGRRS